MSCIRAEQEEVRRMPLALGLLISPLEAAPSLVETVKSQLSYAQNEKLMEPSPVLFGLIIMMRYKAIVLSESQRPIQIGSNIIISYY